MKPANATKRKIRIKLTGQDAHSAYISFPGHQKRFRSVARTVSLNDQIKQYEGPRVYLDFDASNRLVGIEVLASMGEVDQMRNRITPKRK